MAILPLENDYQLNVIILGTTESPGICTLSGHDREKNWDNTQAKGTTGATSKLNGDNIGKFDVEFELAGDTLDADGRSDFERWEEFRALCFSTVNGPSPTALPIYHPDLAANGFTEVTLQKMGGMVYDKLGGARVRVTFQEFKPPRAKPAAKATGKGNTNTGKTPKPDPNADAKRELAELLAQAKKP